MSESVKSPVNYYNLIVDALRQIASQAAQEYTASFPSYHSNGTMERMKTVQDFASDPVAVLALAKILFPEG